METIDFKYNKPVLITLAFSESKPASSKYPGSIRTMRTTKDAKVFFCDPQLEQQIKALNPAPGVQIEITKTERENRKGFDWKVERVGQQSDGTYKIPKADSVSPQDSEPASVLPGTPTTKEFQSTTNNAPQSITELQPRKEPKPTDAEQHCFRLVDLTASTMRYAETSTAGRVTRDDARAIALTVYIQAGRSGKLRWRANSQRRAG